MAAKRLNQATLAVTIEVLEKELHKDLKNYETAASENRLQIAETAFELADDRMKRIIKNYEIIIKQSSPTLQVAAPSGSNTPPSTTVTPPMNAMQLQVSSSPMNIAHLLPRIEITKFYGDLYKIRLRPIEKFSRLKLHLTEDAAGAISYLDLTDNSYNKAIDILTGKYNKPRSVKADHYIAITELPRVERQDDFKGQRKLHDKAMGHALNLGSLDQHTAQNEAIMEILWL
ncbi:hypothetical protein OUZ56_023923 [Daphnia magna]|uniref:Uncharacterized protein n=1 Tax=Daphnia magna TaxID=35525 RepID=A0ABR0AZU0_9CRUS|nr:hypothetical protein OUZ56_023923 [Daphnia magna]